MQLSPPQKQPIFLYFIACVNKSGCSSTEIFFTFSAARNNKDFPKLGNSLRVADRTPFDPGMRENSLETERKTARQMTPFEGSNLLFSDRVGSALHY